MTDYERTTIAPDHHDRPGGDPSHEPSAVRTTERTYSPPGPGGATVAARFVTFLFGVLQAA